MYCLGASTLNARPTCCFKHVAVSKARAKGVALACVMMHMNWPHKDNQSNHLTHATRLGLECGRLAVSHWSVASS